VRVSKVTSQVWRSLVTASSRARLDIVRKEDDGDQHQRRNERPAPPTTPAKLSSYRAGHGVSLIAPAPV
jgi:hypothetical protein